MGRKDIKGDESAAWQQPSLYTFVGEYGPFKVKENQPIEDTLVWLYSSGETNSEDDEDDDKDPRKHPMYPLAAPIQDILLDNKSCRFSNVLVIDLNDMFESREEYEEALQEEEESLELTKKLGKKVLLVMHNRHFSRHMLPQQYKSLCDSWINDGILYKTPPGMNDDWFWMHAALKYKALVVTNDEMRDHHFQMMAPKFFLRWKERHQIHFDFGLWGKESDRSSPNHEQIRCSSSGRFPRQVEPQ